MRQSPSGLYLPDDGAELFSISWDAQATEHEIDQAIALNGTAANWFDGRIETDVFTDHVAEILGDPYGYLNYVQSLLPEPVRIFKE